MIPVTNKRILIVEDNPLERELYGEVLKSVNLNVDEAADGEEALNKLLWNQYDLVLLDVNLPKITGLDVLREIRNSLETKNLPVVLISNLDESVFLEEGRRLGINDYLIKADQTPDKVISKVKGLLGAKKGKKGK